MYTYKITEVGYEIYNDDKLEIVQPHYPNGSPSEPILLEDREPMAIALVDELNSVEV